MEHFRIARIFRCKFQTASHSFKFINSNGNACIKEDLAKILEVQLMVPTHFDACVKGLLDLGMTASLEIGPGHALSAFAKQADKGLKTWQVGSLAEYQQFVEEEQNGFTK